MRSAHDCGRAFARARRSGSARRFIRPSAAFVVAVASVLAACNDSPSAPTAPQVAARSGNALVGATGVAYPIVGIQPQVSTLAVGAKVTLLAKLTDGNGVTWMGRETTWKSSDPTVLAVTMSDWGVEGGDKGSVTALKAGKATITATTESNTSQSLTITVGAGALTTPVVESPTGGWNLPAGGAINFGGPVPCSWTRNGGNGRIGLASAATNPDGTRNTDVRASGYRVMFPAGQVNDPAWDMYFDHTGGTGTYYIGWKQRWQPRGSYGALLGAMNSGDSKAWAPKGPSGGDLTIMSWMGSSSTPVIGLDFQGVDDHAIPDVNQTGGSGTMPVTSAMRLPGLAAGNGAWDQEEILIVSDGTTSTSKVSFFVNGAPVGTATGITNASAWTATEQYLSRSVYSGTQAQTTYTDLDQVTIAVK